MSADPRGLPPAAAGLWPGDGARVTRRPGRAPALLLLPSAARPRVLVPAGVPGAHRMLRRNVGAGLAGQVQDAVRRALATGQRAGVLGLLPFSRVLTGPDGVDALVRAHVPHAAAVGVLLGPPRANAKPVLQVFDARGRTVAFGKVGHDAAAGALVRTEARVLADLARVALRRVQVPRVLFSGAWHGQEVLLMTALPAAQRQRPSWTPPVDAMAEIACSAPADGPAPAWELGWVQDLAERAGRLDGPAGARVRGLVAEVRAAVGRHRVLAGRWHGDWAPWNCAADEADDADDAGGRVQVWDWERSATGVPVGLDLVHFTLQQAFRDRLDPREASDLVLAAAGTHLRRWYPARPPVVPTVLLHLLELAVRYTGAGAPTRQVRERLDLVHPMVTRLVTLPREPAHD